MRRRRNAASAPGVAVLYVNHTSVIGGAEHALLEHLRIIASEYQGGAVLCPPGELADALERRGATVILFRGTAVSFRFTARSLLRGAVDFVSSARAIRRAARDTRCGVVYANSIRAGLMCCFARFIGGPPVIVHVHDVLPPGPVSRIVRWLLLRRAAALVAVSGFARDAFVAGLRPSHTPFPVIHNPIEIEGLTSKAPERARARDVLGLPPNSPVLGIVGQITPWKGQDTAISALADVLKVLPDTELLIVGETRFIDPSTRYDNRAYRAKLDGLVEDLGVSHAVRFLGHRDDIPLIMRALDVLLLPSSVEPLGRAMLEAMVLGTPVVATTVGGPSEVIENGRTGFLVAPGDVTAWAARIRELLQDPQRRLEVTEQAHQAVFQSLASGRYEHDMTSLFTEVKHRGSRSGVSQTADSAAQHRMRTPANEPSSGPDPVAEHPSDATPG
jgi:glycosyltransferase involved in cell wall biosynthesis